MKILITLQKRQPRETRRYLINLFTKSLIDEVCDLIKNKKNTRALKIVFREGLFEREIHEDDVAHANADLILSDRYARWDLTK